MSWKIKIKGDNYIAETVWDELRHAVSRAEDWRSQGAEVWIEDADGNKVDEAALKNQTQRSDDGIRDASGSSTIRQSSSATDEIN